MRRHPTIYEQVRCLSCAHTYPKRGDGGTMKANPGCPRCGYVGWAAARREDERLRETG